MLSHQDDFLPFLEASTSEDLSDSGMMTPEGFVRYCTSIRDTAEWGGEPEILALSRTYNVPIHVVQGGRPSIVIHNPENTGGADNDGRVVRISYHRRMYGLGEVRQSLVTDIPSSRIFQHYNSLRPENTFSQLSHKVQAMLSS